MGTRLDWLLSPSERELDKCFPFRFRVARSPAMGVGGQWNEEWNEEEREVVNLYQAEMFDDMHNQYLSSLLRQDRWSHPTTINQHAAQVTKDTYDWLELHHVPSIFSPEAYTEFIKADFPTLANRIYKKAELQGIDWACKFFTWMCVVDEQMELAVQMSPRVALEKFLDLHKVLLWSFPEEPIIRKNLTGFVDAFPNQVNFYQGVRQEYGFNWLKKATGLCDESDTGNLEPLGSPTNPILLDPDWTSTEIYPGNLGPLGSCLRDLWRTCIMTMPQEFNLRLAESIQRFLSGTIYAKRIGQDNNVRIGLDNTVLYIEQYKILRRATPAVELTMIIVDLVYKVRVSEKIVSGYPMKIFLTILNDIITWHHDLWSFRKNCLNGDVNNLVFIISQEHNCSYAQASMTARDMVWDKLQELDEGISYLLTSTSNGQPTKSLQTFQEAFTILHQLDQDYQGLSRYIETCHSWIVSTQKWHKGRADYNPYGER